MTQAFSPTGHPHNEYVEEFCGEILNGRILYHGTEVATLCYCEDYRWAELYAAAPALLEACRTALDVLDAACDCGQCGPCTIHAPAIRAAIAMATPDRTENAAVE